MNADSSTGLGRFHGRLGLPSIALPRRLALAVGLATVVAPAILAAGMALAAPTNYVNVTNNVEQYGTGTYDWGNNGTLSTNGGTYSMSGTGGIFDGGKFNGNTTPPTAPGLTSAAAADSQLVSPTFFVDPLSVDTTGCGSGDPTVFTGQGSETNNGDLNTFTYNTGSIPNKDDLGNVFATAHVTGSTNEVFFGAERVINNGDSHIDFEFLQAGVTAPTPCKGTFVGHRTQGDLLLSVDFTKGGTLGGKALHVWICDKTYDPAHDGLPCDPVKGSSAHYEPAGNIPGFHADAITFGVNATGSIPAGGWVARNADGSPTAGNTVLQNAFMEGGIDLTELGFKGCLSTFLPHTRSSQSFTAVLKDFAGPIPFDSCKTPTITTSATASAEIGSKISDSAKLSGTAAGAGGNIVFTAYGPETSATCAVADLVFTSSAVPVTGNGTYGPVSFNPAKAGDYYWIASYSGDIADGGRTKPASTSCGDTGEKSTVTPKQPTISTKATAGPVTIGGSISDTATLSGTALKPNGDPADGSITFTVYSDDTCTTLVKTLGPVSVSGDNDYASGSFTPLSVGTYYWIATYSGDSPNTLGAATKCKDANESSIIGPKQPTISTTPSAGGLAPVVLTDSAKLSGTALEPDGTTPAKGTITFKLYGPNDTSCGGAPIFTSDPVAVSGDGTYSTPSGFTATLGGTYEWVAVYSGDPPNTLGVSSKCGDEAVVVTVPQSKLTPTGTTCQQFVDGTAQTQQFIYYSLTGDNKVANNVNPGVFFYYTRASAPSGGGPFSVYIHETTGNSTGALFQVQNLSSSQIIVYDASCNTYSSETASIDASGANVTITISGASANQAFVISVKYSAKSLVGTAQPNPADASYTWDTEVPQGNVLPGTTTSLKLSLQ